MSRSKFYLYQSLNVLHDYSINPETREIYLNCHENNESPELEHKTSVRFIKNLRFLDKVNAPIIVYLQSYGGHWGDGIAIYDAIKNATSYITMICDGYCMSMASVILQAADSRVLMPNCSMMIHHGTVSNETTLEAYISDAEEQKKIAAFMMELFAEKMKDGLFFESYSKAKVKKYLDNKLKNKGDWYISAPEAVSYGLADGIFGMDNYTMDKIIGV